MGWQKGASFKAEQRQMKIGLSPSSLSLPIFFAKIENNMRGNGQKPSLFVIKTLYLRHVSVCITNCGTFSKTVLHFMESLGTVLYLYKVFVAKSKTLFSVLGYTFIELHLAGKQDRKVARLYARFWLECLLPFV